MLMLISKIHLFKISGCAPESDVDEGYVKTGYETFYYSNESTVIAGIIFYHNFYSSKLVFFTVMSCV